MRRSQRPDLSLVVPAPPARAPVAPRPPRTAKDDDSAESIKRRLDELLASDRAKRNVSQGRVSPALYQLERAAKDAFRPKWSLSHGSPRQLGSVGRSLVDTLRGFGRAYLERLEEYVSPPETRDKEDEKRPKMLEGYRSLARAAEREAGQLSCVLCVRFRLDQPPVIRVKRRSENAVFTRLAKRALERALRLQGKRRPPKGEACYRFAAKFHRVPPLPIVGCNFDEVRLRAECFYPFKKILRREVTLLSADEG